MTPARPKKTGLSLFRDRLYPQWRASYSRVEAKYEGLYLESLRILRERPELQLQSIFFGVYEEDPGGELVDSAGHRYCYRHATVAVRRFLEEWGVGLLSGRRSLSGLRGDRAGSMASAFFYHNDRTVMRVSDRDEMVPYVIHSLELDDPASTGGWVRRLALLLCGNSMERLARALLRVNRARLFYAVDVRDTDPREELELTDLCVSRRIGLIMFVSRLPELPAAALEEVSLHLRQIFYDVHLIRLQARAALKVRDDMFLSLVNTMPLGQIVHDTKRVLYANPAALRLLGARSAGEMSERPLIDFVHPAYREVVWERMQVLRQSPPGVSVDLMDEKFLTMDGREIDVEVLGVKVNYFGTEAVQIVFRDIGERKRLEQEREYNRLYDPLTGLPNRSLFLDRLNQAILRSEIYAQSTGQAGESALEGSGGMTPVVGGAYGEVFNGPLIGVLYLDIDNFRQVNDLFQFQAGDELLCEITARMEQFVPPAFTFSRLSGDKFCVFLPHIESTEQAIFFAEGMQDLFRLKPFQVRGEQIPLTFSAGISFYPLDGSTGAELLSHCEIALSRAKRNKNQLQLYNREMNIRTAALFVMEKELLSAMAEGQFLVYFQPQIDTARGIVRGVEALLRWKHPIQGIVLPGEFISLAEERGLILEIGEWLLEEALSQVRAMHLNGFPELELSINVTPRQLEHTEFVHLVQVCLRRTDFDARLLKFEIVERGIIDDNEKVRAVMDELAGIGIRFHVDDFGTGGAAITYVRNFPIDTIKIDKSFVHELNRNEPLVRGLVAFAESLGLQIIVEGVETREQLTFFEALGCCYFQGYYFARPMLIAECEKFIRGYSLAPRPTGRMPADRE